MTAAAILDAACPPLCSPFVEELMSRWRISVDEARHVRAIVDAWGDEKANGRGQAELRAEIRERVLSFLRTARRGAVGAVQ